LMLILAGLLSAAFMRVKDSRKKYDALTQRYPI
jgi:hypothetical protein